MLLFGGFGAVPTCGFVRTYVCTLWEVAEFGSQTSLNIVEKVIEVGELEEGNKYAAAGK